MIDVEIPVKCIFPNEWTKENTTVYVQGMRLRKDQYVLQDQHYIGFIDHIIADEHIAIVDTEHGLVYEYQPISSFSGVYMDYVAKVSIDGHRFGSQYAY